MVHDHIPRKYKIPNIYVKPGHGHKFYTTHHRGWKAFPPQSHNLKTIKNTYKDNPNYNDFLNILIQEYQNELENYIIEYSMSFKIHYFLLIIQVNSFFNFWFMKKSAIYQICLKEW